MSFRGQYYAVRNGSEAREDLSNIKFTKRRVFNGIEACNHTFGKVTDDMFVKGIGSSRTILMTHIRTMQIINDPEGWISMAGIAEVEENANTGTV